MIILFYFLFSCFKQESMLPKKEQKQARNFLLKEDPRSSNDIKVSYLKRQERIGLVKLGDETNEIYLEVNGSPLTGKLRDDVLKDFYLCADAYAYLWEYVIYLETLYGDIEFKGKKIKEMDFAELLSLREGNEKKLLLKPNEAFEYLDLKIKLSCIYPFGDLSPAESTGVGQVNKNKFLGSLKTRYKLKKVEERIFKLPLGQDDIELIETEIKKEMDLHSKIIDSNQAMKNIIKFEYGNEVSRFNKDHLDLDDSKNSIIITYQQISEKYNEEIENRDGEKIVKFTKKK